MRPRQPRNPIGSRGGNLRALEGPVGLVGAGYIGPLFAQQFALAGYQVRAWSPVTSGCTLRDRLRQSASALAEIGAVEPSAADEVLDRVSVHDDLAAAIAHCAAVMEAIVEDAGAKVACYRDIEAAVGSEVLLWERDVQLSDDAAGREHGPP
jgi:3-hydroxyacyl-CoA dehydrogenase